MTLAQIHPITAARSLYALFRNPDDTQQVFRLLDAVSPGVSSSFSARFERSRSGARLLAERPQVLTALTDRARLAAMPDGSLGRAYLAFMLRDGLDAEWLVRQSEAASAPRPDDARAYISRRLRDTHDLWHTVTGYGGDLLGEASLLAFTYAQTWNAAIGLIVSTAYLKGDEPDARRLMLDAMARGLRSAWFPAVEWEELLDQPLDAVRVKLRVGPPPAYTPVLASELPPGGVWAT